MPCQHEVCVLLRSLFHIQSVFTSCSHRVTLYCVTKITVHFHPSIFCVFLCWIWKCFVFAPWAVVLACILYPSPHLCFGGFVPACVHGLATFVCLRVCVFCVALRLLRPASNSSLNNGTAHNYSPSCIQEQMAHTDPGMALFVSLGSYCICLLPCVYVCVWACSVTSHWPSNHVCLSIHSVSYWHPLSRWW